MSCVERVADRRGEKMKVYRLRSPVARGTCEGAARGELASGVSYGSKSPRSGTRSDALRAIGAGVGHESTSTSAATNTGWPGSPESALPSNPALLGSSVKPQERLRL